MTEDELRESWTPPAAADNTHTPLPGMPAGPPPDLELPAPALDASGELPVPAQLAVAEVADAHQLELPGLELRTIRRPGGQHP